MSFDIHAQLLEQLNTVLEQRVANGWDDAVMSQRELARRSGVPQPNISAIFAGKSCLEEPGTSSSPRPIPETCRKRISQEWTSPEIC